MTFIELSQQNHRMDYCSTTENSKHLKTDFLLINPRKKLSKDKPHLQCQHPIWVQVRVLAAPFSILLPTDVTRSLHPRGRSGWNFGLLAPPWSSPGYLFNMYNYVASLGIREIQSQDWDSPKY